MSYTNVVLYDRRMDMCGRFSIDETVIPEIEAIVGYVDSRLRGGFCGGACGRDIHPSEEAPVLAADSCGKMQNGPCIAWYRWEFRELTGNG